MNGPEREAPVRQEDDRVAVRHLQLTLLGTLLFSLVLVICAWLLLRVDERARTRLTTHWSDASIGPPVIGGVKQTLINQDTSATRLHDSTQQVLYNWGWVDRSRGIIHMPVETAMQVIVERARQ